MHFKPSVREFSAWADVTPFFQTGFNHLSPNGLTSTAFIEVEVTRCTLPNHGLMSIPYPQTTAQNGFSFSLRAFPDYDRT